MKKTLFLAAVVAAAFTAHAELMEGVARPAQNGTWVWTSVTITQDNLDSYLTKPGTTTKEVFDNTPAGAINIGVRQGEGSLTIDGVDLISANCVFVGGKGWQNPQEEPSDEGNSGTVTVTNGGSLTVGGYTGDGYKTWAGSAQLSLAYTTTTKPVTGTLNVTNGGKVYANAWSVVGGGNGTGVLNVSGEGSVFDMGIRGAVSSTSVQLLAAKGSESTAIINVTDGAVFTAENAGVPTYLYFGVADTEETGEGAGKGGQVMITVDNATAHLGTAGSIALLGYNAGATSTIDVKEGGVLKSGGALYIGYYAAGILTNAGTVEVSSLCISNWQSGIANTGTVLAKESENYGNLITQKLHIGEGTLDGAFNTGALTNCNCVVAGAVELTHSASFTNDGSAYASLYTDKTIVSDNARLAVDTLCIGGSGVAGAYNTLVLVNKVSVDAGGADKAGVVATETFTVKDGSVYNYGLMDAQNGIELGDGGYLLTGTLTVAGRENAANDGNPATLAYTTGLTDGTSVSVKGENVAVGAVVTSATGSTQYVTGADLPRLDAEVLDGLNLTDKGVKVVNELDSTIQASLTTAEVNDSDESVIVAVKGSTVVIEKSGEADGTLGSYNSIPTETQACIRVTEDEATEENNITWKGNALKTIEGETTILTSQTSVTTDSNNPDSKLVVVENSTLNNQGTVNSAVQVDGTLKGTGTVNGTVTVGTDGHLVIGNSPGYMSISALNLAGALDISVDGVETASSSGHVGWGSGTYSQLTLTQGALSILDGASINIYFGGDTIFDGAMGKEIVFDMAIITGITSLSINGIVCDGTLTETAVQFLVDNTHFELTCEVLGLPNVGESYSGLAVTGATYSLEDTGDGKYALHVKGTLTVPEPASATLSLLALAALAARRRRARE